MCSENNSKDLPGIPVKEKKSPLKFRKGGRVRCATVGDEPTLIAHKHCVACHKVIPFESKWNLCADCLKRRNYGKNTQ